MGTAGEDHKALFAVKDQGGVVQQLVLFPVPIQFGDHLGVGVFELQHPGDLPQEGEIQKQIVESGVEENFFAVLFHIKTQGRFPLEIDPHQGVVVHQNSDFHHGSSFE